MIRVDLKKETTTKKNQKISMKLKAGSVNR